MYFLPNKVFNARNRGDNCGHWILCISAKKNPIINLHHMMDFGNGKYTINNDNAGQIAHSMDELVRVAGDCLQEMYQWGATTRLLFATKERATLYIQGSIYGEGAELTRSIIFDDKQCLALFFNRKELPVLTRTIAISVVVFWLRKLRQLRGK